MGFLSDISIRPTRFKGVTGRNDDDGEDDDDDDDDDGSRPVQRRKVT